MARKYHIHGCHTLSLAHPTAEAAADPPHEADFSHLRPTSDPHPAVTIRLQTYERHSRTQSVR